MITTIGMYLKASHSRSLIRTLAALRMQMTYALSTCDRRFDSSNASQTEVEGSSMSYRGLTVHTYARYLPQSQVFERHARCSHLHFPTTASIITVQ